VEWVGIIPFRRKEVDEMCELQEKLERIRAGDTKARNQLLQEYIPFIAKSASQATGRYIRRGMDDEFSIALTAFNEAIDHFDFKRGTSFLSFADTVIKRRLIDFFRSKAAKDRDVPFTEFEVEDDEDNIINYVEVQKSLEAHAFQLEEERRREEIGRYMELLSAFNITLEELVELSPKHADARQNAMEVARVIAEHEELRTFLYEKKALPLKQLMQYVSVSRKTVERQRKYIIAIALILTNDLEMLQEYIL
jgi:RNA polymerase sigma factor